MGTQQPEVQERQAGLPVPTLPKEELRGLLVLQVLTLSLPKTPQLPPHNLSSHSEYQRDEALIPY